MLFNFGGFIIGIYQKYRIFSLFIDLIKIFYKFSLGTWTNILLRPRDRLVYSKKLGSRENCRSEKFSITKFEFLNKNASI